MARTEPMGPRLTRARAAASKVAPRPGPGQATSYMVGRPEIEQLRREADTRLGPRFDIREFHDRVLDEGAVALVELRALVERSIASRADSAT